MDLRDRDQCRRRDAAAGDDRLRPGPAVPGLLGVHRDRVLGSIRRAANCAPGRLSHLLRLFTLPDRSLAELVAVQHLAGLAIGTAVYAALIRSRLPRLAAAAAAALVLLDGYAITLEQYVMSDTFFTVLMLAAVLVVVWPRLGDRRAGRALPGRPSRVAP